MHAPSAAVPVATPTARDEWRAYPFLPVAAGLGYATSVIHIYGIGPSTVLSHRNSAGAAPR
ncbi:hypothetical protein ACFSHP_04970 [Novosphingobium panipatense]